MAIRGRNVFRGAGVDDPLSAVTAGGNRHGLVIPTLAPFVYGSAHSGGNRLTPIHTDPLGAVLAKTQHALAVANLVKYYGTGQPKGAADAPLDACTTKPRFSMAVSWLAKMRGTNLGQLPGAPLQA